MLHHVKPQHNHPQRPLAAQMKTAEQQKATYSKWNLPLFTKTTRKLINSMVEIYHTLSKHHKPSR